MIDLVVNTEGSIADRLHLLSKRFPSVANYAVSEVAKAMSEFEKRKFLSGQYLNKETSETYDSVKFFKLKKGTFGVRPGSGITGRLNYLNVFVRGSDSTGRQFPQGNFVDDSAAAFFATDEAIRIFRPIAMKSLRKNLLGGLK